MNINNNGELISLKLFIYLFNLGYNKGHDDTVESGAMYISGIDMDSYHADIIIDLLPDLIERYKNY